MPRLGEMAANLDPWGANDRPSTPIQPCRGSAPGSSPRREHALGPTAPPAGPDVESLVANTRSACPKRHRVRVRWCGPMRDHRRGCSPDHAAASREVGRGRTLPVERRGEAGTSRRLVTWGVASAAFDLSGYELFELLVGRRAGQVPIGQEQPGLTATPSFLNPSRAPHGGPARACPRSLSAAPA